MAHNPSEEASVGLLTSDEIHTGAPPPPPVEGTSGDTGTGSSTASPPAT